jgi:hypothetical protein
VVFAAILLLLLVPWYIRRRRFTVQKTHATDEENGNFREAPYKSDEGAVVRFFKSPGSF